MFKKKMVFRIAALLVLAGILTGFTGTALCARRQAPLVIAHRGAVHHAPENTLPSFEIAMELGAHGVETDLFITKDGVVVLSHDSTIRRCSNYEGEGGRISEMTLEELREYCYGSWFSEEFAGTPIPTLDEFLDLVVDVEVILLEFKTGERDIVQQTVAAVQKRNMTGQVVYMSFDMNTVQVVKDIDEDAYTAILYNPGSEWDRAAKADLQGFVQEYRLDALHPQYAAVSPRLMRQCARLGIEVRPWTVNDYAFLLSAAGMGVDGIITDQPERALCIVRIPQWLLWPTTILNVVSSILGPLF